MKRKSLILLAVAVAAFTVMAQEKKDEKAAPKAPAKSAILHPEMKVESGTYAKPMATLGSKPDQPWSTTTTAAGVDSKPQPGRAVTRVGEIVDFSCYIQLGKHGEKHRACGQKCVQNGQPIGLLTQDGTLYMLMPEEHDPRRGCEGIGCGPYGAYRGSEWDRGVGERVPRDLRAGPDEIDRDFDGT